MKTEECTLLGIPMLATSSCGASAVYYNGHVTVTHWCDTDKNNGCPCTWAASLENDGELTNSVKEATYKGVPTPQYPVVNLVREDQAVIDGHDISLDVGPPLLVRMGNRVWGIDIVLGKYTIVGDVYFCREHNVQVCG